MPGPQLFVQGERDALADPLLVRRVLGRLPAARHLELAGADHSLSRSRKHPMRDADEWLDAVAAFAKEVGA